jgi:RimJ/RimL family protein N-acetyltransferase
MGKIKNHDYILQGEYVTLRPMTENDWDLLLAWNSDPEVLYFAEGDNITSYTLPEVKDIYCSVCQNAFCFIIEVNNHSIGECWLQRMNLERILKKYPALDCRRIDLMIGEKDVWRHGYGTETLRLLTEFAFAQEKADMVFGCDIADYNPASLRAFQKNGYQIVAQIAQPPGHKAQYCTDVMIARNTLATSLTSKEIIQKYENPYQTNTH